MERDAAENLEHETIPLVLVVEEVQLALSVVRLPGPVRIQQMPDDFRLLGRRLEPQELHLRRGVHAPEDERLGIDDGSGESLLGPEGEELGQGAGGREFSLSPLGRKEVGSIRLRFEQRQEQPRGLGRIEGVDRASIDLDVVIARAGGPLTLGALPEIATDEPAEQLVVEGLGIGDRPQLSVGEMGEGRPAALLGRERGSWEDGAELVIVDVGVDGQRGRGRGGWLLGDEELVAFPDDASALWHGVLEVRFAERHPARTEVSRAALRGEGGLRLEPIVR